MVDLNFINLGFSVSCDLSIADTCCKRLLGCNLLFFTVLSASLFFNIQKLVFQPLSAYLMYCLLSSSEISFLYMVTSTIFGQFLFNISATFNLFYFVSEITFSICAFFTAASHDCLEFITNICFCFCQLVKLTVRILLTERCHKHIDMYHSTDILHVGSYVTKKIKKIAQKI